MHSKRKILISLALLVIALFSMVSVTFAWISIYRAASSIFNITLITERDSLFIKLADNERGSERSDDYSAAVTRLSDITYSQSGSGDSWRLTNESGALAHSNDYLLQQYTFFTSNPKKSLYFLSGDSSLQSQLRSRSFSSMDKNYFLSAGRTNINIARFYGTTNPAETDDTSANVVIGGSTYYFKRGGSYATSAAAASRMMFFQGQVTDIPVHAPIGVWNPNPDAGYDAKNPDGSFVYPEQVSSYYRNANTTNPPADILRSGYALPYYPINGPLELVTRWTAVTPGEVDYYSDAAWKADITLVLWLEGKDVDCFNVILGDSISADLAFKLA